MTNTIPNTPASAGNDAFAREAADRLLTEQWPVMSMFLTQQACIDAREKFVRGIIQQAIERDRAERDAELTRLREELGKSIDRELVQAKTIAEREAELAPLRELVGVDPRAASGLNDIAHWRKIQDRADTATAKLAEQSAALALAKLTMEDAFGVIRHLREAENEDAARAGRNIPWPPVFPPIPARYSAALAQIEALAGKGGHNHRERFGGNPETTGGSAVVDEANSSNGLPQ